MGEGLWHCTGGSDQDHPQEKRNAKKAKWLREEALQIAEKWREAKGKGEKERYTHVNVEFQRIARRDKKAFLSDWSEVKLLSHVRLFSTPWTVAYQAPPSMGFSRQEYWSGLPFPSPRDLSDLEIEQQSPVLQTDALLSEPKENNRVRKTRALFNKTRDTKGIFHANMGTIKGRNNRSRRY